MKLILIYSSKTGNTKKVADAIQEKLKADCVLTAEEWNHQPLEEYDCILLGGWIDRGHMNASIQEVMKGIQNKKVAFFFTLGAYPASMHAYECIQRIREDFEKNNNEVLAHFHCQGSIDPKLIEWMKGLPKDHGHSVDEERLLRWEDASKHPNQEDFHSAYSFAANLKRKLE